MSVKNLIIKFINSPEKNIYSSQTLYECLFFLIENSEFNQSYEVVKLIIDSQLEDGGFDIGYDFLFGKGLTKTLDKEGTTPETLSITALGLFLDKFSDKLNEKEMSDCKKSINLGLEWIFSHHILINNVAAIPYAPHSFQYVHITNATSFALSAIALGWKYAELRIQEELKKLYHKLTQFMYQELVKGEDAGMFWPYFYQNGTEYEKTFINDKVDNYHIAQQLYFHIISNKYIRCEYNDMIIKNVGEYLLASIDNEGFIPYTKRNGKSTQKVDVWGFSSVIMALAETYSALGKREFLEAALKVNNYLFTYCKAKDYFYPIIDNKSKSVFDSNFYPRSDAWVIHAVSSLANKCSLENEYKDFCQIVYTKIKIAGFRGKENHTYSTRKKFFVKILSLKR